MPANLPPTYYEKERELKYAQTPEEKIQIYLELLAIMPKHKGTDKLKGDLRQKISKLKKEIGKKPGTARTDFYHVAREGSAQVVLLGMPNTGKSQILKSLTNAEPEVRDYPFTTQKPQVGMILYDNIQIQLIDMPPISRDFAPGWIFGIARGADLLLIVLDLNRDMIAQSETILSLLNNSRIDLQTKKGLREREVAMLKKALFICNKSDIAGTTERIDYLIKKWGDLYQVYTISAKEKTGTEELKRKIYDALEIIRVYTKPPHHEYDRSRPYVLKKGSKVIELASQIHKDFMTELKYVRLWRAGKYNGMRIDRDEILQDEDVVEFHTK
jgi:ribosome-interacting GTPase 1